ncbi:MAG: hypothetical protein WCK02_08510 [Bacteroidota bacterium]
MPFINEILKHKSLSIVGLEKNTGKTECLNYVLRRLKDSKTQIALTSIGIDGEGLDQVTNTHKPEIEVFENMIFVTSEKHYKEKQLLAEILDISERRTSLGRLITAKAINSGKLMFSGPANTLWLKQVIDQMKTFKVETTIVDGALSRLSLGSPAITESMVLATGAAVSANIPNLVKKTKFVYNLINIEEFDFSKKDELLDIEKGIWAIDDEGNICDLEIPSVFLLEKNKDKLFQFGFTFFVSGAISDNLLNFLRVQKQIENIVLVVRDFTRIFVSQEAYINYIKKGGKIKVLLKTNLLAVCINPVSPEGYVLDSNILRSTMADALQIPVYDIMKI